MGGTSELTRQAAAYLACVGFALTYLLTAVQGGAGWTAVTRGAVVALCALVLGRLLIGPALSSVLEAMARDQAQKELAERAAEKEQEAE